MAESNQVLWKAHEIMLEIVHRSRIQQRNQIFHVCSGNITHAPSYKLRDNKHILIKSIKAILHNSALFYAQKFVQVKSADVNEPMKMWNTELESENR